MKMHKYQKAYSGTWRIDLESELKINQGSV